MYILVAADLLTHVKSHELLRIATPDARHGHGWEFAFTNQMLMAVVVAGIMLVIFPRLFASADSSAPRGARNFFEAIIEFLRVEVFRPALKEHTDRFVPFLWTLFFFILFSNLLGLIPFGTLFGLLFHGHGAELGGTATGNIWNTAALASLAFVIIHASGILQVWRDLVHGTYGQHGGHEEHSSGNRRGHDAAMDLEHMRGEALAADVPGNFSAMGNPSAHYADGEYKGGHGHPAAAHDTHAAHAGMPAMTAALAAIPLYLWNFAPHPFRPAKGESSVKWAMDIPVWGMLLLLELLGALIKPFALAIRLFANMIAGHLVLAALLSLVIAIPFGAKQIGIGIPVVLLSIVISLLEVFVAFLQAYIFTFLTTLFIASAVAPEH